MSNNLTFLQTWYAVYTKARNEKKVNDLLARAGIHSYLPLVKTLKQWADRKKWVEEPLFRSYVFVSITQKEYLDVLNTAGVVRFVTFEGRAVPIPPQQIEAIRQYIESGEIQSEDFTDYEIGQKVQVIQGPMKGLEGTLVSIMRRKRVRIEISGIGKAVYIKLPASYIRSCC